MQKGKNQKTGIISTLESKSFVNVLWSQQMAMVANSLLITTD